MGEVISFLFTLKDHSFTEDDGIPSGLHEAWPIHRMVLYRVLRPIVTEIWRRLYWI